MTPTNSGQAIVELVDRNGRDRDALQLQLEALGLQVEAFASLTERAGRAARNHHACVLCGLDGASQNLHEFDDLLAEIGEGTPVVLLGRAPPLSLVVRALKAGAVDVLRRPVGADDLARAMEEAVVRSQSELLQRTRISELRERLDRLTAREREVFDRLITGQLNKQVGAELGITERTVKAHRASILRKLSVGSVAELVRLATTLEFAREQMLGRASAASRQFFNHHDASGPVTA
jgi:FixJ family two-component response regulator